MAIIEFYFDSNYKILKKILFLISGNHGSLIQA